VVYGGGIDRIIQMMGMNPHMQWKKMKIQEKMWKMQKMKNDNEYVETILIKGFRYLFDRMYDVVHDDLLKIYVQKQIEFSLENFLLNVMFELLFLSFCFLKKRGKRGKRSKKKKKKKKLLFKYIL
jgi:hypothetical protein